MAVANSASAIPGATTASDVLLDAAMPVKLLMIPQTVPNSPTKGATEPTVARMLSRSERRSTSVATAAFIRLASRSRVPARSTWAVLVDRRHSSIAADITAAIGSRSLPRLP
jgi:hypothetical protein